MDKYILRPKNRKALIVLKVKDLTKQQDRNEAEADCSIKLLRFIGRYSSECTNAVTKLENTLLLVSEMVTRIPMQTLKTFLII
jgi:hypothetical protein